MLVPGIEFPNLGKLPVFVLASAADHDALAAIEQRRTRATERQLADETSVLGFFERADPERQGAFEMNRSGRDIIDLPSSKPIGGQREAALAEV